MNNYRSVRFNFVLDHREAGSNWEYAAGILASLSDHDFATNLRFDPKLRDNGAFVFTVTVRGYDEDHYVELERLRSFRYGITEAGGIRPLVTFDWVEVN